jgi:uncharacterized membrane protein YhdT
MADWSGPATVPPDERTLSIVAWVTCLLGPLIPFVIWLKAGDRRQLGAAREARNAVWFSVLAEATWMAVLVPQAFHGDLGPGLAMPAWVALAGCALAACTLGVVVFRVRALRRSVST